MKVSLEELDAINVWMRKFERADLLKIQWFHRGKEIKLDPFLLDEWQFCGLNNRTFAEHHLIELMPHTKALEENDPIA